MSVAQALAATKVARLPQHYLLFLGHSHDTTFMKTALGLRDWARDRCVGEYRCDSTQVSVGLPYLDPENA
jgi:hypothetical protein